MFVQVISGMTNDREGLRRQADRWEEEVRPGAAGFLGSTSGVTDDGRMIAVVRFESEGAARRNSARDEQGAWWAETEKYLEGVTFKESTEITTMLGGASNRAGFVQVMLGRVTDVAKLAEINARTAEFKSAMRRLRPDVLGDIIALHPDGTYTDVVYFVSEQEARDGEGREMPADAQAMFEGLMAAITIDEYLDLKEPWLR
jgi:hypothetical protein